MSDDAQTKNNWLIRRDDQLGHANDAPDRASDVRETGAQTAPAPQSAPVAWIARHPRRVLWLMVAIGVPYLLLCWAVTFTLIAAMLSGGCGG